MKSTHTISGISGLLAAAKVQQKAKKHKNIKCDCGHLPKDHNRGEGYCHDSPHPNAGKCGCTWYHPNIKWVMRQQLKEILESKPESRRYKKLTKAIAEKELIGIKIPQIWLKAERKLAIKYILAK